MGDSSSFGDWIRRRRKALDLTQAELAQRAIARAERERAGARREAEQHTDRANGNLGPCVGAGDIPVRDCRQKLTETIRGVVVLLDGEAERPAQLECQAAQEREFGGDEVVVG